MKSYETQYFMQVSFYTVFFIAQDIQKRNIKMYRYICFSLVFLIFFTEKFYFCQEYPYMFFNYSV